MSDPKCTECGHEAALHMFIHGCDVAKDGGAIGPIKCTADKQECDNTERHRIADAIDAAMDDACRSAIDVGAALLKSMTQIRFRIVSGYYATDEGGGD